MLSEEDAGCTPGLRRARGAGTFVMAAVFCRATDALLVRVRPVVLDGGAVDPFFFPARDDDATRGFE
jgi:hypothetical protein